MFWRPISVASCVFCVCVCVCAKSFATLQPVQERGTNVAPGCRKLIYLSWAVPFPLIFVSGREPSPVASDDDPLLLHKYTGKWHNLQPHAIQFTSSDVSSTFYCDKILQIMPVSRTVFKSANRTEKVHLEKMSVTYLVKKFHTKSLRVLTVFTRACHRALTWTQTPCSTAHFTNVTVARLVKNPLPAPHFYETKGSSPFHKTYQETLPSAKLFQPHSCTLFLNINSDISLSISRSYKGDFHCVRNWFLYGVEMSPWHNPELDKVPYQLSKTSHSWSLELPFIFGGHLLYHPKKEQCSDDAIPN